MAWLIPSEVQPLETRSVGQSFATAVNFLVGYPLHLPPLLGRPSRVLVIMLTVSCTASLDKIAWLDL